MDYEIKLNLLEQPKIDFKQLMKKHFVDISEELKLPPVAISIGETQKGDQTYPIPFGTYGNFSCIVGASKSRKTFLKSLLEACYIGGNSTKYAEIIKGRLNQDKYVVSIDTEQGIWSAQQAFRRPVEMCGFPYEKYAPFALREMDWKQRIEFIEYIFMESEYKDNLGLVTIDGAADLVPDVNDLERSNELLQKLMKWSTISNCHIIVVLHKNFGTQKPTGNLGSAILKKAETVAMVSVDEQDKSISNVDFAYTRVFPIDPISYSIDNDWLPYLIEDHMSNSNEIFK